MEVKNNDTVTKTRRKKNVETTTSVETKDNIAVDIINENVAIEAQEVNENTITEDSIVETTVNEVNDNKIVLDENKETKTICAEKNNIVIDNQNKYSFGYMWNGQIIYK